MKWKVPPFIRDNIFTISRYLYVFTFRLFSNTSKSLFESNHILFCREFEALSVDNKDSVNHRKNMEEIFKILRGPLFLGHPLVFF